MYYRKFGLLIGAVVAFGSPAWAADLDVLQFRVGHCSSGQCVYKVDYEYNGEIARAACKMLDKAGKLMAIETIVVKPPYGSASVFGAPGKFAKVECSLQR